MSNTHEGGLRALGRQMGLLVEKGMEDAARVRQGPPTRRWGQSEWDQVLRGAGYGAAGGLATAGVVGLLHELALDKRKRKLRKIPRETTEDTIVLTLPEKRARVLRKAAEILGTPSVEPLRIKHVTGRRSSTATVPVKSYRAGNYGGQQMKVGTPKVDTGPGIFTGMATPDTLTNYLRWLSIPVAGVATHKLVSHLARASIKKRLKAEEERAKQHMLELMQGTGKLADWVFGPAGGAFEKEGATRMSRGEAVQRMTNPASAAALLMMTLGVGGTAWLTKRLLDAKARERDDAGWSPPPVRRIVFRTQPVTSARDLDRELDEKQASSEDIEVLQATIGVLMEKFAGAERVLNLPDITEALSRRGLTKHDLYKMAQAPAANPDFASALMEYFPRDSELRNLAIRRFVEQYPVLQRFRWGDRFPLQELAMRPELEGIRNALFDRYGGRAITQYAQNPELQRLLQTFEGSGVNPTDVLRSQDPNVRKWLGHQMASRLSGSGAAADFGAPPALQPIPPYAHGSSVDLRPLLRQYGPLAAGAGATLLARGAGARGFASYLPLLAGAGVTGTRSYPQLYEAAAPHMRRAREWGRSRFERAREWGQPRFEQARERLLEPWRMTAQPEVDSELTPVKVGGVMPTLGGIANSFLGNAMAQRVAERRPPAARDLTPEQLSDLVSRIRLEADDDEAGAYLEQNRERLSKVLSQMVRDGRL